MLYACLLSLPCIVYDKHVTVHDIMNLGTFFCTLHSFSCHVRQESRSQPQ
jgi:hypothetical protein